MIFLPLSSNRKLIWTKSDWTKQAIMGILRDVFNALQAFKITKIYGQPTDDNINKLMTQLTAALVTISTSNGVAS